MKKLVALLMCLTMIIPLFSCNVNDRNNDILSKNDDHHENSVIEETADNQPSADLSTYQPVLNVYRLAIDHLNRLYGFVNQNPQGLASELFGLDPSTEKEWFLSIIDAIFYFYGGHGEKNAISPHYKLSCGYAIKDLNGDGVDELVLLTRDYMVCAIFSVADGQPILLRHYGTRDYGWIDGDGSIHENGSDGAAYSTNAVYKIADGGAAMELVVEFGTNGVEWVGNTAHTVGYQLVNGEKITITEAECAALTRQYGEYLGYDKCAKATKISSGLKFLAMYTKDEISVFDVLLGEKKLKNCYFESNNLRVDEASIDGKAVIDIDKDGICEFIIRSSSMDSLILRYYNGKVYCYSICFNLNVDGSFSWNYSSATYGVSRLYFDGELMEIKEIYKVVNGGEPNAEYYIDGKQVTHEKLLQYIAVHPNIAITFTHFAEPWQKAISLEEALEIASEYWYECYNIKPGDRDSETGFPFAFLPKYSDNENYCIALAWLVEGSHYSTIEIIEIDAFTGEIILPSYDLGGK